VIERVLIGLAVLSVVTFLVFGWDKRKARNGRWRTPEATLLLLAWLGGFVGAWWGMKVFRHKTRKTSFRVKMLLATILSPAWLVLYYAL
jgi:uncharacterized membrane protein YsdA (DUF1294 family)